MDARDVVGLLISTGALDVKTGKVDVDKNPELAKQFRVMSIPTLILFKDGKIVDPVELTKLINNR